MLVDRLSITKFVDGKLTQVDASRLDVFFDESDMDALMERGYTMDRMMGCTDEGAIDGWAVEDKVHVRLQLPRDETDHEKVAELALDTGGDLYFTIWNSNALRLFVPVEFTAGAPFVTSDPGHKLGSVGITTVCLHQLAELAQRL